MCVRLCSRCDACLYVGVGQWVEVCVCAYMYICGVRVCVCVCVSCLSVPVCIG